MTNYKIKEIRNQGNVYKVSSWWSDTPWLFWYAVPFHNATVKYTQKDNVMWEFYDESNTWQKNALKQYYNADSYLEFSDAISRHYRTGLASNITSITSGKITYWLTTPIFDAETLTDKEYNLDQDGKLVSTRTKENWWSQNSYWVMISRFTDPTDNKVKSFSYVSNNSHDITIAVNTWEWDNIISSENKTITGYANYAVDTGSWSVRSYKNIIRVWWNNSWHSNARVCALYVYEWWDFTKIAGWDWYANSMNLIAIDEENWYMYFYYYSGNHDIMSRYDMNNRTYWAYWDRTSWTWSNQRMGWPTVVDVKDGKAVMYYTYWRETNVIREIDLINKTVSGTDKPITYSIREDYKEFYEKMFDEKWWANPTGLSIIETDWVAQLNKIQYSWAMTHTSEIISGECYNIKLNDISLKSEDWYEVLWSEHALYNNAKYWELYAISDKTLSTAWLSINSDVTISNLSTDKNYLDIQFDVNQNGTWPSWVYATSIVGMSNSSWDNTRTTFDIVF